ncbi:RabGAP TBC [Mycena metata]|uniref:RabGAP TBC n=1 Tax=Mycena metata TaxID=1033252 RepID=A0AAD7JTJ9_9AGAR|nr:RabGAP TBC [Mycena metata]
MSMASNQGFSSSSETSMDARRQQELKWVSLMDAVPPAQARKSKKVKKLLMDGTVPSSVRFRVWAYLTDTKAMVTPGVYAKQLVKRPRAPAFVEVEREIQRIPSDYPRINQTPLLSVLHAYLSIVPDIQYSIGRSSLCLLFSPLGLTLISGHLVTLAPEEDAFWIFVSIMNSYLRPYFSSNTTQIDVDTALFRRALEANDAQVAKKVLRDMSVNLAELCHSWFSTLFVNTLPLDYLNRVWGLFLYDGIPFLFRVGLTLFHCCRRQVLGAINQESLFDVLNHPSPNWLPPLNTFVDFAYGVRLKDGDLRKQRENTKDVAKLLARPFSPPPPRFSDRFAGL